MISARLFEKGNQIIYELDSCQRMVSLFKRNLFGLEKKVRDAVVDEMKNKFMRKDALGSENFKRFKDYRNQINMMAASDFS